MSESHIANSADLSPIGLRPIDSRAGDDDALARAAALSRGSRPRIGALVEPTPEQVRRLELWRKSTFWVMLIGYMGYYVGRANLPVAMPLLSQEFGYSNSDLGIILTASEFVYAAGKFTTGPIADRIGGKQVFLVGICGAIVFNLAFPAFTSLILFTILWCLCRFFLSMGWSGIIKTIGEWYEPERNGTVMGLISVNFQFGSVLATVFCGYLLTLGIGWKGLFYYPALVMAIIAVWAALASKSTPAHVVPGVRFGRNAGKKVALADFSASANESATGSGWEKLDTGKAESARGPAGKPGTRTLVTTLLRLRTFRQVLLFAFLTTILRSIFMYWTPKFLVDLGMGNVAAAMSSAVFPFLGCVGTIFLGWYTDHHAKNGDRARMMWIMLVGLTLSLLIVAKLASYRLEYQYWLVAFLGLSGFFLYGPYSMSAGALTLDIAGAEGAGTCAGIVDGVGYIGGALASWGAGYLSDRLGWAQVFACLAVCALFSVISAYDMSRAFQKDYRAKLAGPSSINEPGIEVGSRTHHQCTT